MSQGIALYPILGNVLKVKKQNIVAVCLIGRRGFIIEIIAPDLITSCYAF